MSNSAAGSRRYRLGVDLGTTYTSAAIQRDGVASIVQLTTDSHSLASIVALKDDGGMVVGEAAARRALTDPTRVAREFKRRFGDAAPLVLGGTRTSPEALTEALLREVLTRVETAEGGPPESVTLTHPAAWGPFRLDKLRDVAAAAGVAQVHLLAEPVAAAMANADRLATGALVAVYDLGGGTFDAAVVRAGSQDLAGNPEGVERLGGLDIDALVMQHVDEITGGLVGDADITDRDTRAGLARLADDCRLAKESLSTDSEADIPVMLPSVRTSVRLTRSELEAMVRPRLADSLAVLDRVVASAGATWAEVDAVLLVGGSSRMPLVAQLVREHTGRPVMTATNPNMAIAIGAAMAAPAGVDALPTPSTAPDDNVAAAGLPDDADARPTQVPPAKAAAKSRTPMLIGLAAAAAAVVGLIAFVATSGGDDNATDTSLTVAVTPANTDVTESGPTVTEPAVAGSTTTATGADGVPVGDGTLGATVCSTGEPALATASAIDIDGGQAAAIIDGDVYLLTVDAATCALALDTSVAGGILIDDAADLQNVSLRDGRLAASGLDGGVTVDLASGAATPCGLLQPTVNVQQDGDTIATWTSGRKGYDVLQISASGECTIKNDNVLDKLEIRGLVADDGTIYAGIDNGTLAVARLEGNRTIWTQGGTSQFRSIDGLSLCGPYVCVLDTIAQQITVIDIDGNDVATVATSDLGDGEAIGLLSDGAEGWLLSRSDGASLVLKLTFG